MTKSTSGGCDEFETSPDAIEPELRTDRLKTNYSIDVYMLQLYSAFRCKLQNATLIPALEYVQAQCS